MCRIIENTVHLTFVFVYISDWHDLRSKHRICGALIGSLPSFPRQNDFAGNLMINDILQLIGRMSIPYRSAASFLFFFQSSEYY